MSHICNRCNKESNDVWTRDENEEALCDECIGKEGFSSNIWGYRYFKENVDENSEMVPPTI